MTDSGIYEKRQLLFYLYADRMMNRGLFSQTFKQRIKAIVVRDPIMRYLETMRYYAYYKTSTSVVGKVKKIYYGARFRNLGLKLGFSIAEDVLGYGCVIPHYGTIVVGSPNKIGNYAVLHTSTCITANGKIIGDGLYLSTGAKITTRIKLGNNVSIGANSVVNKDFEAGNAMIAGAPAHFIKDAEPWYGNEGMMYDRVRRVEELKIKMNVK